MVKIDRITGFSVFRAYATKEELPEALKELSIRAKNQDILPHIIQVQCSEDFSQTEEFEIMLWGD